MKFDCLDKNTPILGCHFLEASAGTGKTFAIEHVFCRLLLENPEEISIDELLVVTFTRAATHELRVRIRKNLQTLLSDLKKEQTQLNYFEPFLKNPEKTEKILLDAIRGFEDAQIFTIHGFCHRMLNEYAFEAGLVEMQSDENDLHSHFTEQKIAEFLQFDLHSDQISYVQISKLVSHYRGIPHLIRVLIQNLFGKHQKYCSITDSWIKLKKHLSSCSFINTETWKERCRSFIPRMKKSGFNISEIEKGLQIISEWRFAKTCEYTSFERFLEKHSDVPAFFSVENEKKRVSKEEHDADEIFDFFRPIRRIFDEVMDIENILSILLSELNPLLEKEYEKYKIYPPNLLLQKMCSAIGNIHFVQKIQSRFQAVIIDEFQDTDSFQWEIFKTLFFNEKKKAFYLVGDPKQSIYSFRSADLYVYFDAAREMGEKHHFFLETNFRSIPSLISNLNTLFSAPYCNPWLHLPKKKETYSYHPVKAGIKEEVEIEDQKGSIHFFLTECDQKSQKWPNQEIETEKIFPYISNEILHLVEKGVLFSEIALLVKDRFQANLLKEHLERLHIPTRYMSRSALGETKSFFAIQELFHAVFYPENTSYMKIVLAGPLIGINFTELEELKEDWIAFFYLLKKTLMEEGLSAFFSLFLKSTWKKDLSVEEKLVREQNIQDYQETKQIIEYLLNEEKEKCFSKEHLFSILEELKFTKADDQEKARVRSGSSENSVRIITTHMSKGLEFSYVFAIGISSRNTREKFDSERQAEKLRQLYVAWTRAKKRLYIPSLHPSQKTVRISNPSPLEVFVEHLFHPVDLSLIDSHSLREMKQKLHEIGENSSITYETIGIIIPNFYQKKSGIEEFEDVQVSTYPIQETRILSFSQLSNPVNLGHHFIPSEKLSLHSLPPGSHTGVIFHKILEDCFLYRIFEKKSLFQLVEKEMKYTSLEAWTSIVQKKLYDLIQMPLVEGKNLIELGKDQALTELEFYMSYETQNRLHGFIDLLFMYKEKYFLIDWKTNWLGTKDSAYSLENMKKAMIGHDYFLQAKLYIDAIKSCLTSKTSRSFEEMFGGMFYIFLRGIDEPKHHGIFSIISCASELENCVKVH